MRALLRWSCISCTVGLVLSVSEQASAQDAVLVADDNMVEAMLSANQAHGLLDRLRKRVQTAAENDREIALKTLGHALSTYASGDSVSAAERRAAGIEALNSFVQAANIQLAKGRTRYTADLRAAAEQLGDRGLLEWAFAGVLRNFSDVRGRYTALVDYGAALITLQAHEEGDRSLLEAINMRSDPEDGYEARMRYAKHLHDNGRLQEAFAVFSQFDPSVRASHPILSLYRQEVAHELGGDTTAVDLEMAEIREKYANAQGIGPIPKLSAKPVPVADNTFGLPVAKAFSHDFPLDDSRVYGGWIPLPPLTSAFTSTSAVAVNNAEVIYNEARSTPPLAQRAVMWAIRNRATIDMHGCDHYQGSESYASVNVCRVAMPNGPQTDPSYIDAHKRYACVQHGGTVLPGTSQSQMDDSHRSLLDLALGGFIDLAINVENGYYNDNTYGNYMPPPQIIWWLNPETYQVMAVVYPNVWSGNPGGAQEWHGDGWGSSGGIPYGGNYCALNYTCKQRLGNVGSGHADPGNVCPSQDFVLRGDNFFWGRQP